MKEILVLGAGGFIGSHLANRLAAEGNNVVGMDIKMPILPPNGWPLAIGDLRDPHSLSNGSFDEVYQLAADMGGAGFVFTGANDAAIMRNSAQINLNVAHWAARGNAARVFYSSSACVYKEKPDDPRCFEDDIYPALPDSDYGWEKIFSERLYLAYARNTNLEVRIARYHNIFGAYGTWKGGREKAPAAICRKVAEALNGSAIELWGDGTQRRSFLHVDECIEGTIRLMRSDFNDPVNIGSEEMITIHDLAQTIIDVSGKKLGVVYRHGPTGVGGRNSDNMLLQAALGWAPSRALAEGLTGLYAWVAEQVEKEKKNAA